MPLPSPWSRRRVLATALMSPWCGAPGRLAAAPPAGWTRLADMPAPLARFGVAALHGRLHVVGGYDTTRTHWVYDIDADRWQAGPPLPRGSDNLALLALDGRLLAIGGEAGPVVQVFDPGSGAWHAGPALPGVRFASAAAVLDGRLHLAGGWNADNQRSDSLASHAVLERGATAWRAAAPLATARNAAAAAVLGRRLHVVGGRAPGIRAGDQRSLASMEIFDPASDRWSAGTPMPQPCAGLALVALGAHLYALGGESTPGGVLDTVTRYDPATQAWTPLPAMPWRSHGLGAVAWQGALYVMGGFGGPSDAVGTESAALYRWQPTP